MEENLIALLQSIEEMQRKYGVYFDIWAGDPERSNQVQAISSDDWHVIASVERKRVNE